MIRITFLLTFILLLISGCSVKLGEYNIQQNNTNQMNFSDNNLKVSLKPFSAKKDESTLMCRTQLIETPKSEYFHEYIENAFKNDLISFGIYDENSEIKLSGYLENISSSSIGNAYWSYKMTISSSNGKSFTLESIYKYNSSFVATIACNNMIQAFVPSVKKLIQDIIYNPKFKELIVK